MKNNVAIIAIAAVAGSAFAGEDPPPPGTIDLRIVTADLMNPQTSLTVDTTGLTGPIELEFYLQATVINDPAASGVSVFEARFSDDDTGNSNTIGKASLSIHEAFDLPLDDPSDLTGMFPDYRATIGNNNDNPGNGQFNIDDGRWTIVPISLSDAGDAANGNFVNIYKLLWSSDDLSDRTVTIEAEGTAGAYFAQVFNEETMEFESDLMQPAPAGTGTIQVTFVPAPATIAFAGVGAGMIGLRRRR